MKLSYSKLLTYRTCPKKYEFKYIQRLPDTGWNEEDTALGTRGHEVLETYYSHPQRSQDVINDLCEGEERLLTALEGYHDFWKEEDSKFSQIQVEIEAEQKYNGVIYVGRMDLVAESLGQPFIMDHKFKGQWGVDYAKSLYHDEQSKGYAMLLGVPLVVFNLIRTKPAKSRPKFERIPILVPVSEGNRLADELVTWNRHILYDEEHMAFPRNRGNQCNGCPYKGQCYDDGGGITFDEDTEHS